MDYLGDIIKTMKATNLTMAEITEEIKTQICDHYCKYPEQYKVENDDINFDKMIEERCNDCILNLL
jgi:hypothetical protein